MVNKAILSYRTRKVAKANHAKRSSVPYTDAESIGLVFSTDDLKKHKAIKEFIKMLEHEGKKVDTLTYLPRDRQNFEFLFDFFTTKDINLWGSFTQDKVNNFAKKPFDYLFYLDVESNPFIRTVLAMSRAKFRIGKFDIENKPHCEMMIDTASTDIQQLIDEVHKYTKILS